MLYLHPRPLICHNQSSLIVKKLLYLLRQWSVLHMHPRPTHPLIMGTQSVTPHNATASISALSTNDAISAPQVIAQGTEYMAILHLPTTPSTLLTWEHRMKECRSTAYEGLKVAIQGIYDCSGPFPPLQATAGVLLTISKFVDVRGYLYSKCKYTKTFHMTYQKVSANMTDLEQLSLKLHSILSIISKYRDNGGLWALDYRVEKFCLCVESSFYPCQFDIPESSFLGPSTFK